MPPSPATSNAQPASVGYTLGVIMLAVTMVVLSGGYGVVTWMRNTAASSGQGSDGASVTRTLVGQQLTIPGNWLKGDASRDKGFASQVALRLSLPLGAAKSQKTIDVTLLPLSQVRTSASLLDGVYLHQFLPNELSGPAGLVGE